MAEHEIDAKRTPLFDVRRKLGAKLAPSPRPVRVFKLPFVAPRYLRG